MVSAVWPQAMINTKVGLKRVHLGALHGTGAMTPEAHRAIALGTRRPPHRRMPVFALRRRGRLRPCPCGACTAN